MISRPNRTTLRDEAPMWLDREDTLDFRSVATRAGPTPTAQEFIGTSGNDKFVGTRTDDFADLSQGGADIFRGLAGFDFAVMGAAFDARDQITGGSGSDWIELDGDYSAGVTLAAATLTQVENMFLVGGNDYRLTFDDANVAADAVLFVTAEGFSAADTMFVDASAETSGDYVIYGGAGDDTLIGGGRNDLFRSGGGTDTIDGGAGIDRISYFSGAAGITLNLNVTGAQDTGLGILTLTNVEGISGTRFADVLTGNALDNSITANGGADVVNGAGGDDVLIVGVDGFGALSNGSTIIGGGGADIVDFFNGGFATAGVTVTLASQAEQATGQGGFALRNIEDAAGTQFDDTIAGSNDANMLYGGSGNDRLIGGSGNDVLKGDVRIVNNSPNGTAGSRAEIAATDPGADVLIGGAGSDTSFGGAGADKFVFLRTADSRNAAPDTIADFRPGDTIDLSAIDADAGRAGDQAFQLGETAGRAGDILVSYDSATDQTVIGLRTDGDAAVDMTILLSGDRTDLMPADFVL